ncbi:hypothetical protein M0804_011665 [Polistes exclamans]|nr:hypothetical protein M0804_011665 [Polistes exclamans]
MHTTFKYYNQLPPTTLNGKLCQQFTVASGTLLQLFLVQYAINSASSTTIKVPINLPIDAYGDIDLVNRIKTWPKEKQPFWFINWQQIQAHRGDPVNYAQVNQQSQQEQQTQNQSFYI